MPEPDRPTEVPPPHPNGSATRRRAPAWRRRLLWGSLVVLAAVWGYAIWYSVNRPTPEPLDDTSHDRAVTACRATLGELRALAAPHDGEQDTSRAAVENAVFERMVADLRRVRPTDPDGREAFDKWLDDWDALIAARKRYVTDHDDDGEDTRLRIPVADAAPVTVRMDEYAELHGLGACTAQSLQAEVVTGKRLYQ